MSQAGETFFTSIGCMDGRCQEVVALYGQERFGAVYPDTITEAGMVGILAQADIDEKFLANLKKKVDISLKLHHSRGILVHGHAECAGNPVDDQTHQANIHDAARVISSMVEDESIPIIGLFVKRSETNDLADWEAVEINHHEHHRN